MDILTCKRLTIDYEDRHAVEDVSFAIPEGTFLSIVGENGSGKSTLVKGIVGLVPIKKGSLSFGFDPKKSFLGYLPQRSPDNRDFPASVGEVVMSGFLKKADSRPFYGRAEKHRAADVMDELSISTLKRARFSNLSGGQKQRVLLARALCAADRMLVLDEPVAGLDPLVGADFYSILKKLNRSGLTVIMVSHDIPSAVAVSDSILHMRSGRIAFFGDSHSYRHSDIGITFLGKCTVCHDD